MLDGFLVIDKPAGITSHDVVSRIRRILGTRKVGHTGTLDPFATGVLPIAVNDGTKAIPFLDEGVKQYEALMRLGVTTDTLDITGRIAEERDSSQVDQARFMEVSRQFVGTISQIPPMFSAIKQNGQPLYKLARKGEQVERRARQVEIGSFEVTTWSPPLVGVRVTCSRGTYIRSLADDIGQALGCGATLQELRRTASGAFRIAHAITLETLAERAAQGHMHEFFISPLKALAHLPEIPLDDSGLARVLHGRSPEWGNALADAAPAERLPSLVRLSHQQRLIAVAEMAPQEGLAPRIVLKRVFVMTKDPSR